jgi:hypothetical protein
VIRGTTHVLSEHLALEHDIGTCAITAMIVYIFECVPTEVGT